MPTDGLLAGILCLSPALADALRDAVVAHVVGNMEDEKKKPRAWEPQRLFTNTGPGGVIIAATEALLISIRAVLVAPLSRVQSIFR